MKNRNSEDQFLYQLNENIGIVHHVCNIYFTDSEERADMRQEIMYQLWKSYPHFSGESKFSTWMYKVALNTAITHVRKNIKAPAKEELIDKHDQISESSQEIYGEDKMGLLYAAINTLSNIDKAIILLNLEDNSYDEIASITGLTKTNVSVRLVRIKKALKERLRNVI